MYVRAYVPNTYMRGCQKRQWKDQEVSYQVRQVLLGDVTF